MNGQRMASSSKKGKSGAQTKNMDLLTRRQVPDEGVHRKPGDNFKALIEKFALSATRNSDVETGLSQSTQLLPSLANRTYTCMTRSGHYLQDEFIGSSHRLPKLTRGATDMPLLYNHFHLVRCALCNSSYVYRDKPPLTSVSAEWDDMLTTAKHGHLSLCPCQTQVSERQLARLTLPDAFKLQVYKDVRSMKDYIVSLDCSSGSSDI